MVVLGGPWGPAAGESSRFAGRLHLGGLGLALGMTEGPGWATICGAARTRIHSGRLAHSRRPSMNLRATILGFTLLLAASPAAAATGWTEVGDAGNLPQN